MEKIKIISTALFASLLVACGSDNNDTEITTPPTSSIPEPTPVMPTGAWSGNVITPADGVKEAIGMVTKDGTFTLIVKNGHQYTSILNLKQKHEFLVDATAFSADGYKINDGFLSGHYNKDSINGLTVFNNSEASNFDLSPLNVDNSNLSTLADNYANTAMTTSVMLDEDGALSGSDTSGCQYTGTLAPQDEANIYSLSITVSSCANFDGEYTGLATYGKIFTDTPEGLIFQGSNANNSITNILFKN